MLYILLKDLSKTPKVHTSLYAHSNCLYKVQSVTEETETKNIEYLANKVLWPIDTIKEILSYEQVFNRYPEFLL